MIKTLGLTVMMAAAAGAAAAQPTARPTPTVDCTAFPDPARSLHVLPWRAGETYTVGRSTLHWTPRNHGVGLYAIDIPMPIGTKIIAARAGIVVEVREDYPDGNGIDLQENRVFVRHDDGTIGRYIHLTKDGGLVAVGERVRQGQVIALSGNSGGSAAPHLHFDVQGCGPNANPDYNKHPCGRTVPVTFRNAGENACGLIGRTAYAAGAFKEDTPQTIAAAERAAVLKTVEDYVAAWRTGATARLRRALHPDFVRTTLGDQGGLTRTTGLAVLDESDWALGALCKRPGGVHSPCEAPPPPYEAKVLDQDPDTASVRLVVDGRRERLTLAKLRGLWVITELQSAADRRD